MKGLAIRPPIEEVKRIFGRSALRSSGRNAWVTAAWPIRFTSIASRRSSIGRNSIGPPWPTPALLKRALTPERPTARWTLLRAAVIDAGLVTSMVIGVRLSEASFLRLFASFCLRTPAKTL